MMDSSKSDIPSVEAVVRKLLKLREKQMESFQAKLKEISKTLSENERERRIRQLEAENREKLMKLNEAAKQEINRICETVLKME
jgi:DNA repair photolyase